MFIHITFTQFRFLFTESHIVIGFVAHRVPVLDGDWLESVTVIVTIIDVDLQSRTSIGGEEAVEMIE